MRLILVRHGETEWNRQNRIVGHTEIGLNETGRWQVERLARALAGEGASALYCSPLRRARQTADEIAGCCRLAVAIDDDLKEVDAGELDGVTIEEVMQRYGDFWQEWVSGAPELSMPGGESMSDLQDRAWSAVERARRSHPADGVIMVTHTLTIMSILTRAMGMGLADFRRFRLRLASISALSFGQRGVSLELFNATHHLEGAA